MVFTIIGAFVLGLGIYHSNASQGSPKLSTDDIKEIVSTQYPGTITEIEFETDFNKAIYEVEVVSDGKEYDLKLDGNTGEVVKLKEKSITNKDKIVLDDNIDLKGNENKERVSEDSRKSEGVEKEKNQQEPTENNFNQKTVIDSKKAIDITQETFSGIVTELELEKEDGRLIYDVELISGREKAEIEIDAYTGEVLVIEIKTKNSNKYGNKLQSKGNKSLLDAQRAIDIAQDAFDGRVTELELDREDGRLIYEIELKSEQQKAEVEIDAFTGETLKVEIDK